ncbi:hypothetical protein KIH31_16525 [Paenarthrobacter sp. DKR-5]|uniref:hypothetical protein n=1 Tax=Paenarthrobacter sp. DKR-5 TaxID=2835535 RepID=UPI001BDCD033|nr:hypothetical protein [Paenarthrobacter sp. DKR-5]MBT1004193.1 hypothetical protein [Paenarthrobacter sp. DKR-5]
MAIIQKVLAGMAGVAAAAAMALVPASAFAAGPGAGHGGGGGGGGGGGETTASNNLSVPAVFIGSAGFGLTDPALQPPTGTPSTGYEIDPTAYYYVQGKNKWQAEYTVQSTDTATVKWGDNLSGSASLKAGHPVRVEMGLTSDTQTSMLGYTVVKLQPSLLDRNSAYGTLASPDGNGGYTASDQAMPARVWVAGASVTITGPNGTVTAGMPGEINATGAVVFGYNWRPSEPGTYQLKFQVPEGTVSFSNPADAVKTVTVTSGGGGGKRG